MKPMRGVLTTRSVFGSRRWGRSQKMVRSSPARGGRLVFFFQAEDGIRDLTVTGVQTCALPICLEPDLRQVRAAIEAIAPHLNAGHLVILKSTAPPYTTEAVVAPALASGGRPIEIGRASCRERV